MKIFHEKLDNNKMKVVTFIDRSIVKIPVDMNIESLAHLNLENGLEFRNDGYIYKEGNKLKRWLDKSNRYNNSTRMWRPHLKEIKRIEKARFYLSNKNTKASTELWNEVVDEIKKYKWITGFYRFDKKQKGRYVIIKHSNHNGNSGISQNSLEVIPFKLKKPKLVKKYFDYKKRILKLHKHRYRIDNLFLDAMSKKILSMEIEPLKKIISVTINGRLYLFSLKSNDYIDHYYGVEILAYPGDQVILNI